MAGEAAALLDELMGKRRNVLPGKEVKETEWWDLEVSFRVQMATGLTSSAHAGVQAFFVWVLPLRPLCQHSSGHGYAILVS